MRNPLVASTAAQLFYYLVLLVWVLLYMPNRVLLYPVLIVILVGFGFQFWCTRKKHPQWVDPATAILQVVCLFPVLAYAKNSAYSLLFSIMPCVMLDQFYGVFWGAFVLFACTMAAVEGSWMGHQLADQWKLLCMSSGFASTAYFAAIPLIALSQKAVRQFSVVDGLGQLFEREKKMQAQIQWLIEKIVELCEAEFGAFYLWNPKQQKFELEASGGRLFEKVREVLAEIAPGALELVVREGKAQLVDDLSLDPRYATYKGDKRGLVLVSLVCMPVRIKSRIEGAFVTGSALGAFLSPFRLQILDFFTRYFVLVLEQEHSQQENLFSLRKLDALYSAHSLLKSPVAADDFLHEIANFTLQILDLKEWSLFMFDSKKQEFYGYYSTATFLEEVYGLRIPWGEGAISQAAIRKETLAIADISKNPLVSMKENRKEQFNSMLAIPLFNGEALLGVVQVSGAYARTFTEGDVKFAAGLASLAEFVLGKEPGAVQGIVSPGSPGL